ncbi:arrestin domain-containing protein 17 [Ditylenchus destructor]|uniref:Arrestin domain-containing protein 17 n=1 Tax=Ditylenchus destructor TaxID=166010 RepID=A0AAD4MVW9_9BILA|nr:arrestin domain-containing protein 17 [Ditylenchus destructor]
MWIKNLRAKSITSSFRAIVNGQDTYYTAEVSYLRREFAVWLPPSPDYKYIEPGSYEWPFNFTLPTNCPPSFEGRHGYIRYWAHAKVDRPWRVDDTTRGTFTVMPMFDLNMVPYATSPVNRQFSESVNVCCCYSKGRIGVTASLNKAGFVPGEIIFVRLEIANGSSKSVYQVEASLMQTVTNHGQYICHWDTKLEGGCIQSHENPIGVPSGSTRLSEHTIKVPPVVPTIGSNVCSIIQVSYSVQIRIGVSGVNTNDVRCALPILVGTIPAIQIMNPVPVPSRASMQPPSPITLSESDISKRKLNFIESEARKQNTHNDKDANTTGYTPKYVYYDNKFLQGKH